MADPPQPTPFPIKIVQDPAPSVAGDDGADSVTVRGKRNDNFYGAWTKFLAPEPHRAKSTSTIMKKTAYERDAVAGSEGLQVEENASVSWEQAAAECRAKVAAIVEECRRLNQKYRDAIFDLEANEYCLMSLTGKSPKAVGIIDAPPWIKRLEDIFDAPEFFIDGASATDVHQGSSGDCWFLAALMAVSAKKDLVDRLCVARDEKAGVYGFVFYRDGEWISEVIDDKLFLRVGDDDDLNVVRDWDKDAKEGMGLMHDEDKLKNTLQRGGEALYFSHCKSNETWLPLIEKAYAKAHGDYVAIEGGFASEGIEDLTGGVGVVLNPEDIMDKNRFWEEQLSQVNKKYLFGGGSKPSAAKGFVSSHAYAVLQAWEEGDLRLLKLRNPWGRVEWQGDWSDGSKLWTPEMMMKLDHRFGDDGVFWISYADFLKHFPSINRVRLFDNEWNVAQQWTSVNVPWTVDYLDTKFTFTIDRDCPVVVVLSQPDDRFFYGLSGRFAFSLHFRVVKQGEEEKWLVRSMHNSGNETMFTRSVSAEADLETGTYHVLVKVTGTRLPGMTAEEAIFKYSHDRKEKLLRVGRRYDYAQTKGNLRALEESNKLRAKQEAREKFLDECRVDRRHNQKVKQRQRKCKTRIDEARRGRRKEYEMKLKAKSKASKQRAAEKKTVRATVVKTATDEQKAGLDRPASAGGEAESGDDGESDDETSEESSNGDSKADKDTGDAKLTMGLSKLDIESRNRSTRSPSPPESSVNDGIDSDDDDDESPVEEPEELDDNDFDWDDDIDNPIESEDEEPQISATGKDNEIFADDPWNAMCVLGLRVYARGAVAKVDVSKGKNSM